MIEIKHEKYYSLIIIIIILFTILTDMYIQRYKQF